jgi:predicted TIM-barrel enzyme
MGLTTGGSIGAETALTLADCVPRITAWAAAARGAQGRDRALPWRPDLHAEDATYILKHCPHCNGFYGASSMERLPTEIALTEQTRKFKRIKRE